MSELTPITRIEEYLDAIVDGGTPPLEDVTRVETFLDSIYNNTPCALTPVTRIETYLAKISGASVTLPVEPVTRVEQYLAKIAGEDVEIPDEPVTRIEEWLAEWANGGSPSYDTVTGSIASFITLRSAPLKELVVDIEPVQSGSGDPSPDNVRPISGWTGASVTVNCGNVLPTSACYDVGYNPTVGQVKTPTAVSRTWTDNGDGTFSMETLASWAAASFLSVKLPAGKYTAHIKGVSGSFRYSLNVYDADYKVLSRSTDSNVSTGTKTNVVTLTEPGYIAFGIYGYTSPITIQEPCVLIAESFTGYVPYNGTTYTVDWTDAAGTVYSGTLTINEDGSGVLTQTHRYLTLPKTGWTYYVPSGTRRTFQITLNNCLPGGVGWMDRYKFENVSGIYYQPNNTFYFYAQNASTNKISIRDDNYTDATSFGEAIEGAQLVAPLKTVNTYNLTPGQVTALLGQNYLWADTGDVSVTYYYPGTTASPIVGVGTVNNMVI